jgi:hypothetical protein
VTINTTAVRNPDNTYVHRTWNDGSNEEQTKRRDRETKFLACAMRAVNVEISEKSKVTG